MNGTLSEYFYAGVRNGLYCKRMKEELRQQRPKCCRSEAEYTNIKQIKKYELNMHSLSEINVNHK